MTDATPDSPAKLLSRFYSLQAERVESYRFFDEGFQAYLAGAPNYNFALYRQLVHEITQGFSKISEEIVAVKSQLVDHYNLPQVDGIINDIQEVEKTKLELTAKLQIAVQEQKDHPDRVTADADLTDLKSRFAATIEKIVELIEDLKYESEELYETDSTLIADR